MKRFLITTSDVSTWSFERPVLFLGEWCRRYNLASKWSQLDYIVASPFGVESKEKIENEIYLNQFKIDLMKELAQTMNSFHNKNENLRYWQILLGHWLNHYVQIIFNRYHVVENALRNYEIDSTVVYNKDGFIFASSTTYGLIDSCREDIWNHHLYREIIQFIQPKNISIEKLGPSPVNLESKSTPRKQWSALSILSKTLSFFKKDTDAFIVNSYLPKKEEAKLALLLGQFPQLWQSPSVDAVSYSAKQRDKINLDFSKANGFECFIRFILPKMLPVCYVEGMSSLESQVAKLRWPQNPRFIFTSNNFDSDEIFKLWVTTKISKGIPYMIGQHGNNYGTSLGYKNKPELVTSDKFITWGWSDENKKNVPAFIFKIIGRPYKYNPNGGLLLIEFLLMERRFHMDDTYENMMYQKMQFEFVENLSKDIQNNLTIRLHGLYARYGWHEDMRWRDFNPSLKISNGIERINDLIKDSRLVIHSYDSTGMLETLTQNIPTICFWYGGYDHLEPEVIPYYNLLKDAGIIADGPKDAANKINAHWDDLQKWWQSTKVQHARKEFCNRYAKTVHHPLMTLKSILIGHEGIK